MESIIDWVTSAFRGDTLGRLSSQLYESPAAIERGMRQATPLVLAALAEHAQSEQGASQLLSQLRDGSAPRLEPNDVGALLSEPTQAQRVLESSKGFLSGVLGAKLSRLIGLSSSGSGSSHASASTLLGLVSPLVIGWMSKQATTRGLDAGGLSRLLESEAAKLSSTLPSGFGAVFPKLGGAFPPEPSALEATRLHVRRPMRAGLYWLLAALVGLSAVFVWFAFNSRSHVGTEASAPEGRGSFAGLARPSSEESPPEAERQLVAGSEMQLLVLRDNATALASYFSQDSAVPQRFLLDDIRFESGAAELAPSALLDQVAAILAAHSSAQVTVNAYADAQGSEEDNAKLSQRRADVVKQYLVSKGADGRQITAIGMSALSPIADNDTWEGRAQNRRIELVVTRR